VRDWLLEADMAQLHDPPVQIAQHLRDCVTCRSALQSVIASYADLDSGIEQLVRPARQRWLWLPLPLAAAALAALLLMPREKPPAGPSKVLTQLMFPAEPIVTPAAGQEAVVIEKDELTVVWLTNFRGKQ
jgi:hypothetical protein